MEVNLVLTEGPASVRMWHAFRLGASLISRGSRLRVFLLDDGAYLAVSGQRPPAQIYDLAAESKLNELVDLGARVEVCGVCLEHRGLDEKDLMANVRVSTMIDLADHVMETDRTLVF